MKKILVADDDFLQRDLYVELFRAAGYEVIPANDGQEAWEKAQSEYPDLLFTGIMMPRMTGFELIEKIRNNKALSPVPVIIFSHLGREKDRDQAKMLSNVEFKVKGYDPPADILDTAKTLLKNSERGMAHRPLQPMEEDDRPPANLF
ncbi:MAG: hypothetical protein A3J07_03405 [Candidatus Doudnabacteria bacterium RIFCSPLOWO2_02_FULL_49_13]|uniref:Response regulatory domain-containing protein n=1 Tax=Candidatus Doudnabacteria bacterium RIFCSPHIGHO2_12_FULL_48_16 TaxID=1817838 RepID=A0A1F5PJC8_9BACT|nr:MAG: hypothetical protein A3B77_02210 [Candidatus Doudnabacteria bacterium RIFCSPHIGHO2_02_FULL_49_24]OGE89340.1 MAG: hypothetical protein A2760_03140 [Candidatus Doudnabacteria bacterium RIFCSPHIGHO2_01_FULL_50_67]OGE89969.1 MAG: hypothetical protein A3E29_02550 [Candidatus Doudnabacteria bacterium RIFCSPHIGHO2_12_FULL_48_16]OGE97486.1 MAG: hypothetical protein A2990_02085 [Candidatus Doudnabacteria bacterium RIFCSPLOWO2_01_FULL_49_40]OGF03110.1 MAG: hypothetical protein A3J07_03405 [Candid